jgi:rhodanese-related sulfurtransferase
MITLPPSMENNAVSSLTSVTPERAAELVRQGAILIDIREADEHAREHIVGVRHHALSRIGIESPARPGDEIVIFHCRSGARTRANAGRLANAAACEAYVLEGGIEAWKKAGLPVNEDRSQPIELMRQVQIAAGGLALLGAALGYFVTPAFYALSALVGAGLMFAGLTGYCGMATLLAAMPWNRRAAAVGSSR